MKRVNLVNGVNMFDAWEFPQVCIKCKCCDNNNIKEPITVLDVASKLCEYCFLEVEEDDKNIDCK